MKRHTLILSAVVLALLVVTGQPLYAQTGNMWTVSYFNNPDWSGSPVLGTYAPAVDFNWGTVPPGPGMPATNWTATMTSTAYFYYNGTYIFQALADAMQAAGLKDVALYPLTLGVATLYVGSK